MNESVVTGPQRGSAKTARIPIKVEAVAALPKPDWIRVRVSQSESFREVMRDLRRHGVDMLTVGQYLQPRSGNLAVQRYVEPEQFDAMAAQARAMGFVHAACGPLVRSSYHADQQARAAGV
jgi:lipoate synthase